MDIINLAPIIMSSLALSDTVDWLHVSLML